MNAEDSSTVQLPDYNDPSWYEQQEGETAEAWMARTRERSERESLLRNYTDYSEVIDHILENYRTPDGEELDKTEVINLVSGWIYDQGEQAHEEKEQELKDAYDETAEEIASGEGWMTYEPEEDEEG